MTTKKQAAQSADVEQKEADQPVELVDGCMAPLPVTPDDDDPNRVMVLQSFLIGAGHYDFTMDGQYGPRTLQGVQQVQRRLRDDGLDPGPIDGVYGEQTREALCVYLGTPAGARD